MWAVKWFLAVVMILIILGFALQNSSTPVNVVFMGNWQASNVQLWLVIYASFGLGVLFWLVVSIFQVVELKNAIRKLKREQQEIQSELDSLRNLSIGEDDTGFGLREEA